jgi:hypothetical protein
MIERIIILSLCSIGICYTTWDDQILNRPAEWIKSKIGEFWAKPLFGCYVCATLWHSLIICLCVGWPVWYAVPAMGFSAVVSMLQND